jgi:hypothetical protein
VICNRMQREKQGDEPAGKSQECLRGGRSEMIKGKEKQGKLEKIPTVFAQGVDPFILFLASTLLGVAVAGCQSQCQSQSQFPRGFNHGQSSTHLLCIQILPLFTLVLKQPKHPVNAVLHRVPSNHSSRISEFLLYYTTRSTP